MSSNPAKTRPLAAQYESVSEDEDSDDQVPEVRPIVSATRKVSRRDEASDSGYSSHTVTTGSSSQSSRSKTGLSKSGFLKQMKKVTSKKSAPKEPPPSEKTVRRQSTITRAPGKEDLRRLSMNESREQAAKMRPAGPIHANTTLPHHHQARRSEQMSPIAMRHPPQTQSIPIPQHRPQVNTLPRLRPVSYHGPPPNVYHQPHVYQQIQHDPRPQMQPTMMPSPHSLPPTLPPQPPLQQQQHYIIAPGPSSPNRPINYSFPHTQPPQHANSYFDPQSGRPIYQGQQYHPQQHPHHNRRVSNPVVHRHTVEYPTIRQPSQPPPVDGFYQPAQPYYREPMARPASIGPSRYDQQVEDHYTVFEDDEDLYDRHAEELRLAMPPPARPILPRAATTSYTHAAQARRPSDRRSIELPQQSPRRISVDSSRPPSRPGISTRPSHSSSANNRNNPLIEAPISPSNLRRSQSRPISYEYQKPSQDRVLDAAERYQQEQTGHNERYDMTTDAVSKALRHQQSSTRTAKSGRSETASRSSKSSDRKKSKKNRERKADDNVTLRLGKMELGMKGEGTFEVKQGNKGKVEVRVRGQSAKPRANDDTIPRIRDREERQRTDRYLHSGSSGRGDMEVARSNRRSNSRVPASSRYHSERPQSARPGSAASARPSSAASRRPESAASRRPESAASRRPESAADDRKEYKEKDVLKRLRKEGEITPRSRRSSRSSAAPRRPTIESAAEAAAAESGLKRDEDEDPFV